MDITKKDLKFISYLPTKQVFVVIGGYESLKTELLELGWVENLDSDSPCFDMKWTTKTLDIDFDRLHESQFVSHFKVRARENELIN